MLVVTLTLSIGFHWALLQTVAWTGMIIKYSHDGSFTEAVSKTFDGKHPCCLCKMIQQGRGAEKKQEQQEVKPIKLEFCLIGNSETFDFTCHRERIFSAGSVPKSHSDEPPKPRPRTA